MPIFLPTPYTVKTSTRPSCKKEAFNFQNSLKKLCTLRTVENMNYFLGHVDFENIDTITDICIFKEGIEPLWEDQANINGGKWIIKVKREVVVRLFQKMMVHLLVDTFESLKVNGIVMSFRVRNAMITLWTNAEKNNERVIQEIKKILDIDFYLAIEYKDNSTSLQDKSSFRNTKTHNA
ncbi:putative mRNA cap-binding protein [Pseudoloma neurophilia]|uniref:Putative mRNA cap-binding protein n=1 Tax=Pseudoloma neurophilia TaxID=146866 RepID=A0A0R0LZQ1_9MICR|nr:putative mRNA cap-binding protein [Pseudoloma neurophilia]